MKPNPKRILNLLYPPRCPFCGGLLPRGESFHRSCARALPRVPSPVCDTCGRPVRPEERRCEACRTGERAFAFGRSLYLYEAPLRDAVFSCKYNGRREVAEALGILLARAARDMTLSLGADAIVPVPLHKKRLRQRGFNQAAVIASPLARASGIPLRQDYLVRSGESSAMNRLSAEERRRNLAGVFRPGEALIRDAKRGHPPKILLVDDIYTTGSTVEACAAALTAGGAGPVWFLAVCTGTGFMLK